MSNRAPDSRAQSIVDHAHARTLVAEARESLRDCARRVARAGLEARANPRVLKIFTDAVELTEGALDRALESLAEPH
jgi:hypothetical protein